MSSKTSQNCTHKLTHTKHNEIETESNEIDQDTDVDNKETEADLLHPEARVKSGKSMFSSQEIFGSSANVLFEHNPDSTAATKVTATAAALDGGFGWVILGAVFCQCVTTGLILGSFPVIYVDLVDYFQADRGVTGWIGSIHAFTGNFLGIVTGAFIQRFGCRRVAITTSIIGAVGMGLGYFLISIPYLYVTYGIIGGIGTGMTYTTGLVTLQRYFDKKRALALGIGTAGLSVGSMVSYPLTAACTDHYGLSGTFLLSSGVWLQNLVFASLYRPVEVKPTIREKLKQDENQTKILNNDAKESPSKKKNIFGDIIDFSVLKNSQLVLLLIGTFCGYYGAVAFYGHYISRVIHIGIQRRLAILFQSVISVCTLSSRIGFSLVASIKGVKKPFLFSVLVLLSGLMVTVFSCAHTVVPVAMVGAIYGLVTGGFLSLHHTILVEVSGIEHIAKTTGIMGMTVSVSRLLSIPFAGWIYDVTLSYDIPFIIVGLIELSGGVVLLCLAVINHKHTIIEHVHHDEDISVKS